MAVRVELSTHIIEVTRVSSTLEVYRSLRKMWKKMPYMAYSFPLITTKGGELQWDTGWVIIGRDKIYDSGNLVDLNPVRSRLGYQGPGKG
jgi:hypothetical protein